MIFSISEIYMEHWKTDHLRVLSKTHTQTRTRRSQYLYFVNETPFIQHITHVRCRSRSTRSIRAPPNIAPIYQRILGIPGQLTKSVRNTQSASTCSTTM